MEVFVFVVFNCFLLLPISILCSHLTSASGNACRLRIPNNAIYVYTSPSLKGI